MGRHANFDAASKPGARIVFKRLGLILKRGDPRVAETLRGLISYLQNRRHDVVLDEAGSEEFPDLDLPSVERSSLARNCDLALILGGDGSFLNAARNLAGTDIALLGINLGRIGFLTDILPEEMTSALDQVLSGNFEEDERFFLEASVLRAGRSMMHGNALNDVVAHKWKIARLLKFETFIDAHLVDRQRADGLIVATPTGSTAYALSGGGPILHPKLDAIVLVPICPHTLSARAIVVEGNSRIEIVLDGGDQPEAQLTLDGQTTMQLAAGDRICVQKQRHRLRLIHPPGHDYYSMLRAKLHWGEDY